MISRTHIYRHFANVKEMKFPNFFDLPVKLLLFEIIVSQWLPGRRILSFPVLTDLIFLVHLFDGPTTETIYILTFSEKKNPTLAHFTDTRPKGPVLFR